MLKQLAKAIVLTYVINKGVSFLTKTLDSKCKANTDTGATAGSSESVKKNASPKEETGIKAEPEKATETSKSEVKKTVVQRTLRKTTPKGKTEVATKAKRVVKAKPAKAVEVPAVEPTKED